jgi:hypothetical protein
LHSEAFKAVMVSHGKESILWKALNKRLIEEAAMVGDPWTMLAVVMSDGFQEAQEGLLEKLLVWAGIEAFHARALKYCLWHTEYYFLSINDSNYL